MVEFQNISKKYGQVIGVEDVSLKVNPGELFGLIGPDGAGKTTLFRMLITLLLPDEGSISMEGKDVIEHYRYVRENVGYMPGTFSLYQDLTVEENLNFFATLFGTTIEENYDLIKDIYQQIEPYKTRRAGDLSGGMKQKLALSCALIHKPLLLVLDEPTTGVDAVSRKEFWDMLANLKRQGITILVSTPYMDEASLCDRIALIQEGKFLKIDTPQHIVDQFENSLWSVHSNDMSRLLKDLRKHENIMTCFAFGDAHHITIKQESLIENGGNFDHEKLLHFLEEKNHSEIDIKSIKASIEDCFMELAG